MESKLDSVPKKITNMKINKKILENKIIMMEETNGKQDKRIGKRSMGKKVCNIWLRR